jgi:N-acetylneuraminate synthase
MTDSLTVADRRIGRGAPTFVVAELSANHRGSLATAKELIVAIAATGADAVKLQTYTPESLTIDSDAEPFRLRMSGPWHGRLLYDLYAEAQTPWAWHRELAELAAEHGLMLFSSPFDGAAVDLLEQLAVPAYKIASFEIIDHGLIARAASTGKPLIISTGMASIEEIEQAVSVARTNGASGVALLKCTSAYPATVSEMNLRTIADLRERFGVPVGLSDHSEGNEAAVVAVSLGASIIEKHVCLDRSDGGPDAHFSLEPDEFTALVRKVRETEESLGVVSYGPTERERDSIAYRRSLFVVADIEAGATFTSDNVRSIRPAGGLPPKLLQDVIGRRAAARIPRGTPLTDDLIER